MLNRTRVLNKPQYIWHYKGNALNVSFKIARCAVRYDFEGVEERHGNYTILFLSGFQIPCHQARKIRE